MVVKSKKNTKRGGGNNGNNINDAPPEYRDYEKYIPNKVITPSKTLDNAVEHRKKFFIHMDERKKNNKSNMNNNEYLEKYGVHKTTNDNASNGYQYYYQTTGKTAPLYRQFLENTKHYGQDIYTETTYRHKPERKTEKRLMLNEKMERKRQENLKKEHEIKLKVPPSKTLDNAIKHYKTYKKHFNERIKNSHSNMNNNKYLKKYGEHKKTKSDNYRETGKTLPLYKQYLANTKHYGPLYHTVNSKKGFFSKLFGK